MRHCESRLTLYRQRQAVGGKHEASLSYTVPGLSGVLPPCQFGFMFSACPTEMLPTQ